LIESLDLEMAFKRNVIASIAFISMGACTSISYKNQDPSKNNKATFLRDLKECKEDYPETPSGVHIRQWEGCMNLKGWRQL
jgi:hypothetical protein